MYCVAKARLGPVVHYPLRLSGAIGGSGLCVRVDERTAAHLTNEQTRTRAADAMVDVNLDLRPIMSLSLARVFPAID